MHRPPLQAYRLPANGLANGHTYEARPAPSQQSGGFMGSFGPGHFVECFYCDYQAENPYVIDGERVGYVLCPWCWDHIMVDEEEANGPAHWWADWNWERERLGRIIRWCCPPVPLDTQTRIIDFIQEPAPQP